jgi:hypothetical protein
VEADPRIHGRAWPDSCGEEEGGGESTLPWPSLAESMRRKVGSPVQGLAHGHRGTVAVGSELQASKADGFAQGESNTSQVVAAGNDGGFW